MFRNDLIWSQKLTTNKHGSIKVCSRANYFEKANTCISLMVFKLLLYLSSPNFLSDFAVLFLR